MVVISVDAILERAKEYDLSPHEAVFLLKQTDPSIIAEIRIAADKLRQQQVGDTVTYVVNRNIKFTNIL